MSDGSGRTQVSKALNEGMVDRVQLLIEAKSNVDSTEKESGRSSLLLATWRGHTDVFRQLIKDKEVRC